MTLTLSVLRCPDAVPPETKRVTGGEFRIGRGPDNDWIMPDADRMLSKKHCVVAFRNGGWAIADTSTNGTFLNRDAEPIGPGQVRGLRDGDRIRLGAYEIEVRIAEENIVPPPRATGALGGGQNSPFDDPFGDDVFAPQAAPAETFTSSAFGNDPLFGGAAPNPSVTMPARYDPMAPAAEDDFFAGPTVPDHSPSFGDAFKPPPVAPKLIPDDDWDLGLPVTQPARPAVPPAAPPPSFAPPPAPQNFAPAPSQSFAPPPSQSFAPPASQSFAPPASQSFAPPAPEVFAPPPSQSFAPPAPAAPPPAPAAPVSPPPIAASPFAEPHDTAPAPGIAPQPPPRAAAPSPSPLPAPSPAGPQTNLMAAFLAGAGMEGRQPENPEATMRALGGAFRALVAGIRQALIARSSIKGEFRIEQTMIRARGNNPLKFSADDEDALSALVGVGRRIAVTAQAAVADALRDIRLHELATMAAMQGAVRALLAGLDPAKLLAEASGGMLPAQKRAKAFDAYEKLHESVTRALADDFDSVFGKAFARAYEAALRDISAKDS